MVLIVLEGFNSSKFLLLKGVQVAGSTASLTFPRSPGWKQPSMISPSLSPAGRRGTSEGVQRALSAGFNFWGFPRYSVCCRGILTAFLSTPGVLGVPEALRMLPRCCSAWCQHLDSWGGRGGEVQKQWDCFINYCLASADTFQASKEA